jgi:16S rRNA G527 N7-methylase RsmG
VHQTEISALLASFLEHPLAPTQLDQVATYLDLLLRWNSRINLTAIRTPQEIITRHFGESFFLARHLFPTGRVAPSELTPKTSSLTTVSGLLTTDHRPLTTVSGLLTTGHWPLTTALDIGSGAGFPALPLKIFAPEIHLTLIESNHKKSAFLREVIRTLSLSDVNVITDRAENVRAENVRAGNVLARSRQPGAGSRAQSREPEAAQHSAAAKQRKIVAHGASRGSPSEVSQFEMTKPRSGEREDTQISTGALEPLLDQAPEAKSRKPGAGSREPEAESYDLVTFRAVEKFETVLPVAHSFLSQNGTLAILIGDSQIPSLQSLPDVSWNEQRHIPRSHQRILVIGRRS